MSEMLDIKAIRARCEAASDGPWEDSGPTDRYTARTLYSVRGQLVAKMYFAADADFVAHARADVPALLARVETLEAERAALRRLLTLSGRMSTAANGVCNSLDVRGLSAAICRLDDCRAMAEEK